VARDTGREVLKEILKVYQLRIREDLLNGSLLFPHGECAGDRESPSFQGYGASEMSLAWQQTN